jgi:hypothetical protein
MKNEGPFLLEWAAYHKAIGFDDIHVVTNNCSDGTDLMLDRLQAMGLVNHIRQTVPEGESPQVNGLRKVMSLPQMAMTGWLLHIDADEFLRVTHGEGRVQDLAEHCGRADNIALMWRPFGDNGLRYWRGGSVLSSFTRCQRRPRPANAGHKSMFRPHRFGSAIDHMPKQPVDKTVLSVNACGERVRSKALFHPSRARYLMSPAKMTWEGACIHHYATRSLDVFLMKNDRGDGMGHERQKYCVNSKFFRRHNRNEVADTGILPRAAEAGALAAEWLQDSELRALDQQALRWFQDRRDDFLTPERIAALTL